MATQLESESRALARQKSTPRMKDSRRKCLKCGRSPANNPGTVLHRFPKPGITNSVRCEVWAKFCFPLGSWQCSEFQTDLFNKHKMLCTRHFKKTWFIDPEGKKLFKFAIPDHEVDNDQVNSNNDEVGDSGSDDVIDINEDESNSDDVKFLHQTEVPIEDTDSLIHKNFRCNVCCGEIKGFRYTCVLCTDWDMCASCEARGEHPEHYVLRLPAPKPNMETEPILAAIREYIQGLLNLKKEVQEVYFKEEEEFLEKVSDEQDAGTAGPFSCGSDRTVPDVYINQVTSEESVADSLQTMNDTIVQSPPKEPSEICTLKTDLVSYSISNNNIVITPLHINEDNKPNTVIPSEEHKPVTVQTPLKKYIKSLVKRNQEIKIAPTKEVVPINQSTCENNTTEVPSNKNVESSCREDGDKKPWRIFSEAKSESTKVTSLLRQSEVRRPISGSSKEPVRKVIKVSLSDRKVTLLGKRKITPNRTFRFVSVKPKTETD